MNRKSIGISLLTLSIFLLLTVCDEDTSLHIPGSSINLTITAPVDGSTINDNPILIIGNLQSTQPIISLTLSIDQGDPIELDIAEEFTYSLDITSLSLGSHTLIITALDSLNASKSASITIVNSFRLGANLSNTPEEITNETSISIQVSGEDIIAYQFSLDGGEYSSARSLDQWIEKTDLADGDHTLSVLVQYGNEEWQSQDNATIFEWTIDTVAPVIGSVEISDGGDGYINADELSQTIQLSIEGEGNAQYVLSPVNCNIQEGNSGFLDENGNSQLSIIDLYDGQTIEVHVVLKDEAGNTSSPIVVTSIVDTSVTTASISFDNTLINQIASSAVPVSISGAQSDYNYEFSIFSDGSTQGTVGEMNFNGQVGTGSLTLDLVELYDGTLSITGFIVWDTAGNPSAPVDGSNTASKDSVPPAAPSITAPLSPCGTATPTFGWTDESVSGADHYQYRLMEGVDTIVDWSTTSNTSYPHVSPILEDGHTYTFTVRSVDQAGNASLDSDADIEVSINTDVVIETTQSDMDNNRVTIGEIYSYQLSFSGGDGVNYDVTPISSIGGSNIDLTATGLLTSNGDPVDALACRTVITVEVSSGGFNNNKNLAVRVNPLIDEPSTLDIKAKIGQGYSDTLDAIGGDCSNFSFSLVGGFGDPPDGLSLNADGSWSGSVHSSALSSTFRVQVQSDGLTYTTDLKIQVEPEVITNSLPVADRGSEYTSPGYTGSYLEARGGDGTYSWSYTGNLPEGLSLNSGPSSSFGDGYGGDIQGTPNDSPTCPGGAYSSDFSAKVTDGDGISSATKDLHIKIQPKIYDYSSLPVLAASGTLDSWEAYSHTFCASGGENGTYTWTISAGSLPDGLSLNSSTGEITGTPNPASNNPTDSVFTIEVESDGLTTSESVSINVDLILTGTLSSTLNVGDTINAPFTGKGGTGNFTYSVIGNTPIINCSVYDTNDSDDRYECTSFDRVDINATSGLFAGTIGWMAADGKPEPPYPDASYFSDYSYIVGSNVYDFSIRATQGPDSVERDFSVTVSENPHPRTATFNTTGEADGENPCALFGPWCMDTGEVNHTWVLASPLNIFKIGSDNTSIGYKQALIYRKNPSSFDQDWYKLDDMDNTNPANISYGGYYRIGIRTSQVNTCTEIFGCHAQDANSSAIRLLVYDRTQDPGDTSPIFDETYTNDGYLDFHWTPCLPFNRTDAADDNSFVWINLMYASDAGDYRVTWRRDPYCY